MQTQIRSSKIGVNGLQRLNREHGFTLAELIMATSILSLIFLSVFVSLDVANAVVRSTDISADLNQDIAQVLRSISLEIGQTSPNATPAHINLTTDAEGNQVIRFQIPVDDDNDGDADTGGVNPQVTWGAYDRAGLKVNGRLNAWIQYSVIDHQLVREVVDVSGNSLLPTGQIYANNIALFTATLNGNALSLATQLLKSDDVGQKRASSIRAFRQDFQMQTILRNAVN